MGYQVSKDGFFYELGAKPSEMGPGDAVRFRSMQRLELISEIELNPENEWASTITLVDGRVIDGRDCVGYAKREVK